MQFHEQVEDAKYELMINCLVSIAGEKLNGYDGGMLIYKWFSDNTDHPHPLFTFEKMANERNLARDDTMEFALDLADELARLVAVNATVAEKVSK